MNKSIIFIYLLLMQTHTHINNTNEIVSPGAESEVSIKKMGHQRINCSKGMVGKDAMAQMWEKDVVE